MNVARVLRDTTTWTLFVHFPFRFRATEPKQEEKKEGKERKKKRDQALAADRHIWQVISSRWTLSILTLTVNVSHSPNLAYDTIPRSGGASSSSCSFCFPPLNNLTPAPVNSSAFCPCSPSHAPVRGSSLLLDVEDLCRQSVVPVLQLGEAGPLHLWLKLLSDGGGGRGRGMKAVTSGDVYTFSRDKDFEIDWDT